MLNVLEDPEVKSLVSVDIHLGGEDRQTLRLAEWARAIVELGDCCIVDDRSFFETRRPSLKPIYEQAQWFLTLFEGE